MQIFAYIHFAIFLHLILANIVDRYYGFKLIDEMKH